MMAVDSKCLLGTSKYTATEQQVTLARRWVRELLSGRLDDEETLYDVTLCAAELADNARKHGPKGGAISIAVYLCEEVVRLEVTNDAVSLTVPHVTDARFSTDGHGLQIVSSLAKDWGVYENDDMDQVVWCELYSSDFRLVATQEVMPGPEIVTLCGGSEGKGIIEQIAVSRLLI